MHPNESTFLQQAVSALHAGNNESAMEALKALLADQPEHELANGMLASIYAELGMVGQADALYRAVLAQHPGNPLVRFQLGMLQFNRDQLADALATWAPLRATADDYMANFQSALAMLKLDRANDARACLAMADARMPRTHHLRPHLEELQRALQQ